MGTTFATVYHHFLCKITDDMYIELTPEDTLKDLNNMLIAAIPQFEFPRKNLYDYEKQELELTSEEIGENDFVIKEIEEGKILIDKSYFSSELTTEEINILAICMTINWLQRQITSIENTRMKYSGSDFKFTSQANHLQKLLTAKDKMQQDSIHFQRLYKRRRFADDGKYESNWSIFGANSALE